MVKQNPYLAQLKTGYLFPEIQRRKLEFMKAHPEARLVNLGIGDTTRPLAPSVAMKLSNAAKRLGLPETYTGYGPDQGDLQLREKIVSRIYQGHIETDEIFISDGAKSDLGRLQMLFNDGAKVAVQDPAYPVYVDTSIISGKHPYIHPMPCTPENGFFPDSIPDTDILYICSPNNPTGSVATREQLSLLVEQARKKQFLIIFDAAYAYYIQDPLLPKSIFEIEGAREVAIEVNSFSKMAGFTGIRLGWTVVPKELVFEDGSSVYRAWHRIHTTFFNGASNIAQQGGIGVLEDLGWEQIQSTLTYYLENATLIRDTFSALGYKAYGGEHAPFVWVDFSPLNSWSAFSQLLEQAHIVTTPGSGFGACGEGYLRFSAFGKRHDVVEAMARVVQVCKDFKSMARSV